MPESPAIHITDYITVDENGYITAYTGTDSNIIIPDSKDEVTIVGINAYIFSGKNLSGVTLPSNLEFIGQGAFFNNGIRSIVIPASVTTIDNQAFEGASLTEVTFSEGLVTIGELAFNQNNLTSLTIPATVTSYCKK